nr:type III-A CRISPR-associated RAMP protein Csm5 [uncultured Phascolarctobacterium sp.]
MCLRIVTPVNIADGTVLKAKDYLYDAKQQKIYFLNLHEWHKFIFTHDLMMRYEAYIKDFRNTKNLLNWLQEQGYGIDDVQACVTHAASAEVNTVDATKKQTLNDVNQHIQQPDGSLYVPGSSLKGVFRTAILYKLLEDNQSVKEMHWVELHSYISSLELLLLEKEKLENAHSLPYAELNNRKKDVKKKINSTMKNIEDTSSKLEVDLLHTLSIESEAKSKPVCSALRGLQVSDSYASKNIQVAVLQKVDVGFNKEGHANEHTLSVFRECMMPGSELYFDVKIEKAFMTTLGINSIDDLLQATQKFFDAVLVLLQDAFGKDYPQVFTNIDGANMFLGSNTGFLSKTLLALLAPDAKAAKETIRVLLDKSFRQHKHILRDKIISPRTLKCTTCRGEVVLMGLAEVRKV